MVGEQLCLSKALSNFKIIRRKLSRIKFLRVPVGQTFDRLRFALPFRWRRKAQKYTEKVSLCCGFATVGWETAGELYACRACCSLP